jgi:hypothetical protein
MQKSLKCNFFFRGIIKISIFLIFSPKAPSLDPRNHFCLSIFSYLFLSSRTRPVFECSKAVGLLNRPFLAIILKQSYTDWIMNGLKQIGQLNDS